MITRKIHFTLELFCESQEWRNKDKWHNECEARVVPRVFVTSRLKQDKKQERKCQRAENPFNCVFYFWVKTRERRNTHCSDTILTELQCLNSCVGPENGSFTRSSVCNVDGWMHNNVCTRARVSLLLLMWITRPHTRNSFCAGMSGSLTKRVCGCSLLWVPLGAVTPLVLLCKHI